MKRRRNWFVRKAKTSGSCWICKQPIAVGDSITKYGKRWPHLRCAQQHDADICMSNL